MLINDDARYCFCDDEVRNSLMILIFAVIRYIKNLTALLIEVSVSNSGIALKIMKKKWHDCDDEWYLPTFCQKTRNE